MAALTLMYLLVTMMNLSYGHYHYIGSLAVERIEDILQHLGVSYTKRGNRLSGACPVHGGDNYSAWHVFTDGNTTKGNWSCYTHNCHHQSKYGKSFIGLIRGILSHQQNRGVSAYEAIKFLCEFLNIDINSIKIDNSLIDKMQFANQNQTGVAPQRKSKFKRIDIRKKLIIPSEYYIKRGYSAKILNKFDVGKYQIPNDRMENRIIVPVYDDTQTFIGCAARSIFDACPRCELYHGGQCPQTQEEQYRATKWVNSSGFSRNHYLYNYWHSKPFIKDTGVAVIVEGPGDVWRLEEAGIHNSVALFGVVLGQQQREILEKSGAFTLIVLTDNDKAGKTSRETLKESCGKLFTLVFPEIEKKDVGETSVEVIKEDLKPYIESFNI